jgi:SPP1 family predicted phage head-tail adaptor
MSADIGPKREVIQLQQRSSIQGADGEPLATWEVVLTRRAEKLQLPGSEIYSGYERSGRIPTVFKIRHPRSDLNVVPRMRVICEGKLFDIISATDPDGTKVDMFLTCEELVEEPTS